MGFRDCDGDPANGCETMGACQPAQVATGPGNADGITVDGDNVYWAVRYPGAVYSAPRAGGKATMLYGNQSGVFGITNDANNLYFSIYGDGSGHTVLSAPKVPGKATVLSTINGSPGGIAVFGKDVYFTDSFGSDLFKVPAAGGMTSSVVQNLPGRNFGVLVDGMDIHIASANTGAVSVEPIGGGQLKAVAQVPGYLVQLARDDAFFYVAGYGNGIYRVPSGGGAAEQVVACGGCEGVTVDAKFVYFTNYGTGEVSRIAKP
jgi:hypothetical protein